MVVNPFFFFEIYELIHIRNPVAAPISGHFLHRQTIYHSTRLVKPFQMGVLLFVITPFLSELQLFEVCRSRIEFNL